MARRCELGLRMTLWMSMTLGMAGTPFASSAIAEESAAAVSAKTNASDDEGQSASTTPAVSVIATPTNEGHSSAAVDYWSLLFVLALSTLIGLGVIIKVSRLLHTPLMSLTNAISAIAVVGAIIVTGGDHPVGIRVLGFIALFASTTNIVSGFMITDRMLKMFKQPGKGAKS